MLKFDYTVAGNDSDSDGIEVVANSLELNGGKIGDAVNRADLGHDSIAASDSHKVDGVRPKVVGKPAFTGMPAAGGTYAKGETISATVTFSEAVTVTGTPGLAIVLQTVDTTTHKINMFTPRVVTAQYVSGSGTTVLTFGYEVVDGDYDENGISYGANAISGGTIKDANGNTAVLTHASASNDATRKVDGLRPTVKGVSIGSSPSVGNTYGAGETIKVAVQFREKVAVTGTPQIKIDIGGTERAASYARRNTAMDTLEFEYSVATTDGDADGISINQNALALNSGTIKDSSGNAANLAHAALARQSGHRVNGASAAGEVKVSKLRLTIAEGTNATYTVRLGKAPVGGNVTVTPVAGDTDAVSVSPASLSFTGGASGNWNQPQTVTVTAKQDANQSDENFQITHTVSGANYGSVTAPAIQVRVSDDDTDPSFVSITETSSPASGDTYLLGETIQITVRYSEPVFVTGSPHFVLYIGGAGKQAGLASGSGTASLVFEYAVKAADRETTRLSYVSQAIQGGGTIKDADGNDAPTSYTGRTTFELSRNKVNGGQSAAGVSVSKTEVTVPEGGSRTYTVRLLKAPTMNVAIAVSVEGDTDLTVDPASLTFTTANWDSAQTVTVSAAADTDAVNGTATVSHTATSDDTSYQGISIPDVTAFESDSSGLPAKPGNFKAVPANAKVTLSWDDPEDAGIARWEYRQKAGTGAFGSWTRILNSGAGTKFHDVTGLNNGTGYTFQVRAVNAVGNGPPSDEATATPSTDVAEAPGQVTGVSVVAGARQLKVTWTAVAGATGYKVQWKSGDQDFATERQATSTTTSHTIADLTPGTTYTVRVIATKTNAPDGTASAEKTGTPTFLAPAAPTSLTAAKDGRFAIDLSWTAPAAATDRAAATGYEIEWSADGSTNWADLATVTSAATVTYTDSGLDAGTTRHYRVRATSSAGDSAWSATASATTDANSAPVFASTTASRSVAENAAAGTDVGDPLTATDSDGDTLTYSLSGNDSDSFDLDTNDGQISVKSGTSLDYEAKDAYSVTVTATDPYGGSDSVTVTVNVTDVNEPPSAPTGLSVSAIDGSSTSLRAMWTAPTDAGRPAISGYGVQYRQGISGDWTSHTHSGTATSADITSLSASTTYQVQVRATNAEGNSAWTAAVSGTTNAAANAAPSFTSSATASVEENSTAVITVVATDSDAADSVTAYAVTGGADQSKFSITSPGGALTFNTAPDYENPTDAGTNNVYNVTVQATSGAGARAKTATQTIVVTVTDVNEPPSAPTGLSVGAVSGSSTRLRATWTAPSNTGRPAISGYGVRYRAGTSGDWSTHTHSGTATTAEITSLSAGTSYQVQVRATNAEGNSAWTASASGTTNTASTLAQVTGVAAAAGGRVIDVSWTAVSGATGYKVQWKSGTQSFTTNRQAVINGGTTTSHRITGLRVREYTVRVIATKTGATDGPASAEVKATPVERRLIRYRNARGFSVNEGETRPIWLRLGARPTGTVTVEASSPDETALVGASTATFTTANWNRYQRLSLRGPEDADTVSERVRVVFFAKGGGYDGELRPALNVLVEDNDSGFVLSSTALTVTEGDSTGASYTIYMNPAPAVSTEVKLVIARPQQGKVTLSGTTLTTNEAGEQVLTFTSANGTTPQTVKVTAVTDDDTDDETVVITHSTIRAGYALARVTVTVTDATPAAPTGLTATKNGRDKIDLSWTAPTKTVTGYEIEWSADGSTSWTDLATVTTVTYQHSGLDAGTTRHYRVRATSNAGNSAWSATASATTDANSSPAFASATATRSVAENAAAGTNVGAAIPAATDADGDTLTYALGGTDAASFDFNTSTRQITVKSGTELDHESKNTHTVTVTATDTEGGSAMVTVTISVTDVNEPPSAPTGLSVAAIDGSSTSLRATWTAPSDTGRPAISGYGVRYRAGTSGSWSTHTHSGTDTSADITSLSAGTAYQVQVRATNAEGNSAWTAAVSGTTNAAANAAPSFTSSATASVTENSTAVITVVATDADTADSVTAYAVTGGADQSKFSITSPGGALTFNTAPDFENPTDAGTNNVYNVTVQATSGAGARAKTATQTIVVTVTDVNEPPSAPTGLSVSAIDGSSTSLRATWTAPSDTGRPAISGYGVRYRAGTSGSWSTHTHSGTDTSADITSLSAGTAYQVQVRATNAEGNSAWTAAVSGTTNAAADPTAPTVTPVAPPRPTGLTAVPLDTAVHLRWDDVSLREDVFIDKYQYRQRARGASSWGDWSDWTDMTFLTSNTPPRTLYSLGGHTVTGLTNDTKYQIEVRALNGRNPSKAAKVAVTPRAKPAAPQGVIANSGDQSVILHWYTGRDDSITGYRYRMREQGASWGRWRKVPSRGPYGDRYSTDILSHTVTGLTNGTTYGFQVRARNDNGAGTASKPVEATPLAVPGPPQGVTVARDWALIPKNADGTNAMAPGESFRLLYVTSAGSTATSTSIGSYNTSLRTIAANNSELQPDLTDRGHRALISTAAVNARDNIDAGDEGNEAPVYWVKGGRVANSTDDLFDTGEPFSATSWLGAPARDENGELSTATLVWTGSFKSGRSWWIPYDERLRNYAGADRVEAGNPTGRGWEIAYATWTTGVEVPTNNTALPIYGISPVYTVDPGASVAVTSDPGADGTYSTGESRAEFGELIQVTFTFSGAIAITGEPRSKIMVGQTERTLRECRVAGTGDNLNRLLVCDYTVREGDLDADGVSVPENGLHLPAGASIMFDSGLPGNVNLDHPALPDQGGHKVDGIDPHVVGVAVTSDPGSDRTYAAGDSIEVTFTFSEDIVITGAPPLRLIIGRSEQTGACGAHSNTAIKDRLVCTYQVQAGDLDVHGIRMSPNSLPWPSPSEWSIRDAAGNDAYTMHERLGTQSGHKVIAVAAAAAKPFATLSLSNNGRVTEGGTIRVTATLNKAASRAVTIEGYGFTVRQNTAIVIPAGQTSRSAVITVPDNAVDDPGSRVTELPLRYTPADAVDVTRSHQRFALTVLDNDPTPRVTLSLRQDSPPAAGEDRRAKDLGAVLGDGESANVAEGKTFVVWAELDRQSSADTVVTVSVQAAGDVTHTLIASGPGAYGHPPRGPFTTYVIEDRATQPADDSFLVAVRIADDAVQNAGARTLTITATAANTNGVTQSTQTLTVTVTDDD